jgi:hypothetical protein
VDRLIDRTFDYIDQLDTHQWMMVLIVSIVIGAMLLRGFGSRSY